MPDRPKKRSVTCYNLIFPVWLLFSPWGLPALAVFGFIGVPIMLIGNYAVDWLVTALGMRLAHVDNIKDRVWSVSTRVWLLGYAADALSSLPLLVIMMDPIKEPTRQEWFYQNIERPICYGNPYASPLALLILASCLLLAGVLIYFFNMKWGLKNAKLEQREKRRVALTLALLTMPYTFLIPTSWFY